MNKFFCHKAVCIGLLSAGLVSISAANADTSNILVLPGSLQVPDNLTAGKAVTAPNLKGSLSGAVNYTISGPTTVNKANKQVTTTQSLNVPMSQGFCFLSGWNSNGNASSSGSVSYDTTRDSWVVTVGGHDDVKATATCLLWQTS